MSKENVVMAQMPRYQCHKKVWALKIKKIEILSPYGDIRITPEESGFAPFELTSEYYTKHRPAVGGYYVVYDDGYKSYSPPEAFEEGYSLIK